MSSLESFLPIFSGWLDRYAADLVREEREKLAELEERYDRDTSNLRDQRDLARHRLNEHQTQLAAAIDRETVSAAKAADFQELLHVERSTTHDLKAQLEDKANKLSATEVRNSTTEQTLMTISGLLASKEDENCDAKEQLRLLKQQLDDSNTVIVEERERCNKHLEELRQQLDDANTLIVEERERCNKHLEELRQRLDDANTLIVKERERCNKHLEELRQEQQSERNALDRQLQKSTTELGMISKRLQEQTTRNTELQSRLDHATQNLQQMHSTNEKLEARCSALKEEVSELAAARRTISHHVERQDDMEGQARQLTAYLHDEQTQRAELQSTVSAQRLEIDDLMEQRQQLRVELTESRDANATLRRVRNSRYPAVVRYAGSPARM
jgi:chromosome segregation ATPase